MNILLLNDNPVVTKLVTLSAQKTGNEILIASNIEEIPEGSYDLLIVDEALYTPVLFDELESKISFKRSLYMLSRGVASVDGFDNEVKKPFLPTDLVELLSAIAISVANVTEKQKEPEIDLDNLDLEDDLDLDETLSATAKEDDLDLDDLGDLDFDLDSFDLNDLDLDTEGSESDETASVLDQDDVDEVKNLLDETDDDELKLDELDDDFSFDDLDLEEEHVETKEEPKIELLEEEKLEDELEDDFNFDDLDLEEELLEEVAAEEEPTIDQVDEPSSIEEDTLLDELNDEDFSFDELEDKIEEAVGALSSAVEEIEFDHSHIAGGISKINTADNVFGIFTSRAMKERGRYQIQCMKSRSSTGVGQKIDLEYNIETMRITDPGEEGQESNGGYKPATSILNSIKTSTTLNPSTGLPQAKEGFNLERDTAPPPGSSVESSKLKQMLAGLKANSN